MFSKLRVTFIVLSVILLFSCQSPPHPNKQHSPTPTQFTILYDNDHHGRFLPNARGEYGMAARKTFVDQVRQDKGKNNVFYFSGGDINTGTTESTIFDGIPDIKGMNLLAVDAMAVGNHEFDPARAVLMKQQEIANFSMLSANIFVKKTGKLLFPSYTIIERNNVKFAVFGLTTPDTKRMVSPESTADLDFRDPIEVAKKLVPQLRKKADVIVALTHLGYYENENNQLNSPGDVTLARQVPGIDLIVGGHTQIPVCMRQVNQLDTDFQPGGACSADQQGRTIIVQAHEWGKYLGKLEVEFVSKERGLRVISNELIPINLKKEIMTKEGKKLVSIGPEIAQNPEMTALFKPYQEKAKQLLSKRLTYLKGNLDGQRSVVRQKDAALAQLVLQSQIEYLSADLGLTNGGGLRDSLYQGELTMHDVWRVLPFNDSVVCLELKGSELKQYLTDVCTRQSFSGAYPHLRGVTFSKNNGQLKNIVVYGQRERHVVDHETYRVALTSYLAVGGDFYPKHPSFNYGPKKNLVAEVFADYVKRFEQIHVDDFKPRPHLVAAH